MKKYISSTIISGLIVPGLGQVLNGQIKKGLILMGLAFIILITGVVQIITNIFPALNPGEVNVEKIRARIDVMDYSILKIIIIVFLIIWLYSIIDAFITGIKIEKEGN